MPVTDHTYFLAQDDKVHGPRQDLGDFLREQFRAHATDAEPTRFDGASVWWHGEVRHVAITHRATTSIVEPSR